VMQRQDSRTWIKTMIISELSSVYTGDSDPNPPILHSSIAPLTPAQLLGGLPEDLENSFVCKDAWSRRLVTWR
jgi:hypothetical protein